MTPTAAGLARLAGPTDTDLLARFAAARDDAAFAELVRRHAPAVLAVCRRLTGHAQDAEDAFQAAFLVLARKADRVRPGEPVAGWLYGVAVRAARNAASRAWRRRGRETLVEAVPDVPERAAEPFDPDAAAAVLDEVARLPAFLRSAVILCEFEGRPRVAAARELGVAEGTLSSRLAAARKRLAARLAARGFAPAVLAVLAPAAVPPRLTAATSALAFGAPPAGVAALAHGADRTMFQYKLGAVTFAVGLVAVAALAAGSTTCPTDVPRPAVEPLRVAVQPPAPAARPVGPGTIVLAHGGTFWRRCAPDGTKLGEVAKPKGLYVWAVGALSPDGTRLAAPATKDGLPWKADPGQPPGTLPLKLVVWSTDGTGDPKVIDVPAFVHLEPCWAHDGKSVLVPRLKERIGVPRPKGHFAWAYEHIRVDPASGKIEPLPLPDGCHLLDAAPDGQAFLVEHRQPDGTGPRLALTTAGAADVRPLTDLDTQPHWVRARFSPDGKRVLFLDGDPARKDAYKHGRSDRPFVLDVATGKREALADFPENGRGLWVAWSPDGRRVAYVWTLLDVARLAMDRYENPGAETFLMVADADGRNAKTIAGGKTADIPSVGWFDWR